MKNLFKKGDIKTFGKTVKADETASFDGNEVHPFYGTFALARDMEWSSRLFVLEMKEDNEEGIGTFVNVKHESPAMVGDKVLFTATLLQLNENELICDIMVTCEDRIIASGQTGQKILTKEKIQKIRERVAKK